MNKFLDLCIIIGLFISTLNIVLPAEYVCINEESLRQLSIMTLGLIVFRYVTWSD